MQKKQLFTTKELSVTAMFTAITVVLSQIAIPLPFTPVPISLGIVAVYLAGSLLSVKLAVFSQLCYLLLGVIGLPVFANFHSGIGVLFGPTGGFLFTFPVAAGLMAWIINSTNKSVKTKTETQKISPLKFSVAIMVSLGVIYLGGAVWLSFVTQQDLVSSFSLAVLPFLPFDLIKILLVAVIVLPVRERLLATSFL